MTASLDILAEQMLTLVEIVSAQEKDLKTLREQMRRHEEREQAMLVAFTTFFHVLAAKRIAKLDEISLILRNIINVAAHEGRPDESVRHLETLAAMLLEQSGARAEG